MVERLHLPRGLLIRRVLPVGYRPQNDLGPRAVARSGVIFPTCSNGPPPHRRTAPRARPLDDHKGLRPGETHPHAEAGHSVIPHGELAAIGLERI